MWDYKIEKEGGLVVEGFDSFVDGWMKLNGL